MIVSAGGVASGTQIIGDRQPGGLTLANETISAGGLDVGATISGNITNQHDFGTATSATDAAVSLLQPVQIRNFNLYPIPL